VIVAVHQPNYIPWCGYFSKLRASDVFVFLDDAPFPNRSYIPRTKIRVSGQEKWLSVPVSNRPNQAINQVELADENWAKKHLSTIQHSYGKSPHFEEVMSFLDPILRSRFSKLSELNIELIKSIVDYLGLKNVVRRSSEIETSGSGDDRLISIVKSVGGETYLSGPGGENYQSREKFEVNGLELCVRAYKPIPYSAERFPFIPGLSIIDPLFILGRDALALLKYDQVPATN
jgi:hypothetical protein